MRIFVTNHAIDRFKQRYRFHPACRDRHTIKNYLMYVMENGRDIDEYCVFYKNKYSSFGIKRVTYKGVNIVVRGSHIITALPHKLKQFVIREKVK